MWQLWQIPCLIFLILFFLFVGIMVHDPRTLWSGVTFFLMMVALSGFVFFLFSEYAQWLSVHEELTGLLVVLFLLTGVCVLAFPVLLILMFFLEGIRMIRREGMRPANLFSVLFSVLLCGYLFIWPIFGTVSRGTLGRFLYGIISFSVIYVLALMAMYALSAILNLIHLRRKRRLDYIIVLGCGLLGKRVTPLLAARIEKGIGLLRYNPDAILLMSGGQGPGEEVPESEAMAAYAMEKGVPAQRIMTENRSASTEQNLLFSMKLIDKEKPRVAIVTTAYHVFRALLMARQQGIRCVGFGAKTKWYFTLNALIREFIGYLSLTWKKHGLAVCILSVLLFLIS